MELPPELRRVLTDHEVAWRARDDAALARLFPPDGGKFSLTLRTGADGRWLIVTDMDNGNQ